jgi:hypothetical protein
MLVQNTEIVIENSLIRVVWRMLSVLGEMVDRPEPPNYEQAHILTTLLLGHLPEQVKL